MTELQNFIDGYGFGISVQKLAEKAYRQPRRHTATWKVKATRSAW